MIPIYYETEIIERINAIQRNGMDNISYKLEILKAIGFCTQHLFEFCKTNKEFPNLLVDSRVSKNIIVILQENKFEVEIYKSKDNSKKISTFWNSKEFRPYEPVTIY